MLRKFALWFVLTGATHVGCDRTQVVPIESAADESAADESAADESAGAARLLTAGGESRLPDQHAAALVDATADMESAMPPQATDVAVPRPNLTDQTEILNRPFITLRSVDTHVPAELIAHLKEIDSAIQDLVLAGSSSILNEQVFVDSGLRLGRMKREAGKRLAESSEASPQERKAGQLSQLVALSHMSGLRDVEAARELQKFAAELSETADPDLAHQSRVVLLGFEIQALQNGLRDEPGDLLAQLQQLFQRPEDRNFPEFMVLQQAEQVLMQMGFEEEAKQVRRLLVQEYNESPDPQLRGEAWLIETSGSQAYENFVVAFSSLGSVEFDASAALAAVRGLYQQFPSLQTLEQIAGTVTNIEYSGQVALSDDVASFIRMYLGEYGAVEQAEQRAGIEGVLEAHGARTGLLGSPLPLEGLIGFDGQPFQWSDYQGKVVLVDFWATWCIPCMRELPTIRAAHAALNSQGFEVLSVNMDDDLQAANDFVQKQTFPWRTFRADDPSQLGFRAPFAQRLGISAIPFMVLVGQDGKVSGLHVRGQTLIPTIRELLESRAK